MRHRRERPPEFDSRRRVYCEGFEILVITGISDRFILCGARLAHTSATRSKFRMKDRWRERAGGVGKPAKMERSCATSSVHAHRRRTCGSLSQGKARPERHRPRHPVLDAGLTNPHAAYIARAARMRSERYLCSRAAAASRVASSSAVRRRATTCDGSAPAPAAPDRASSTPGRHSRPRRRPPIRRSAVR